MPAGRPTKYTPELLAKCYEYLEIWKELGDMIPSHDGLQIYVGISNACLYDWAKHEDKKEFSELLEKILRLQRQELINKGLSGDFNSNITKLVLGKHGYHDKTDQNMGIQKGQSGKWTVEFINADATPESK